MYFNIGKDIASNKNPTCEKQSFKSTETWDFKISTIQYHS